MAKNTPRESKADTNASGKGEAAAEDEASGPPPRKRSWLKIGLLLVLLLGSAGGGAWYFLRDQLAEGGKPGAGKAAGGKAVASVSSKPPVFVPLEPFTVNLQHDDLSPQYLQVGLSLKLTDSALIDSVKLHMPEIRNRVLLLLSSKKASDISTLEGKQSLSNELVREIGMPLAASAQGKGIDSVLFTSFVIQ